MKQNQVLQRQSLADAVVGRLQQQLSLGVYQPGQKFPSEPELMAQFGVGRSTIREAIRILANNGLLSVRQGSGTFVESPKGIAESLQQRLKRADASDLEEVRQLLEIKIVEKAATHRTQKDITKMKTLLEKRATDADAEDVSATIGTDIDFHIAMAAASGNEILADLYRTFALQVSNHFRERYVNTETFIKTQYLHEQLLQSIIDQEPESARQYALAIMSNID